MIRALKNNIGEYSNYGKYKKDEIERKIYHGDMIICPIPFSTKSKQMMYSMKELVDKGLLVMNEHQRNVIDALKSSFVINEKLDKERTAHDDIFDAMRLALSNYEIDEKMVLAE